MEDEKLADKLLDRILMVLMPYDQIDVERVKAKLTVVLDDYQISPKQEALAVYTEGKNDYYLRKFLLAKAVAGRQERTLRQYKDEVGRALRGIGKDADTITADDIQVYLAKVLSRGGSKCYCDNIRRDLSSFYNWLYREEIIRTNPMNKIDNIKFKREKEKALTDMEIEVMRQACQTTMQKAIMEMLLSTGCRASELVSIKIADMDEDIYEYYPKKRIISSLPFYDRVVNCAAYNVTWPIYSKSFYEHSYGSVPGKGPVRCANTIQGWMREAAAKPGDWYFVKMDITKFFFRIPTEVQLRELGRPLDDADMMWFFERAIRCDGRPLGLPLHCTDVTTAERIAGRGMQVGSLVSQMTANVVMTPADHYIKRELCAPYYARYMDDMGAIIEGKAAAWELVEEVDNYLQTNLGLNLNQKTAVIPIGNPVEFVGRKISPVKIELRRQTTLGMKKHLRYVQDAYAAGEIDLDYALSVITSYRGLFKDVTSDAFLEKMLDEFVLSRPALEA